MAQRLTSRATSFLRKVFGREQEVKRDLGPQRPYFDPSGRDFNLLSLYGYDVVGDYLRLDHDLFTRFYDYEEMDDYPDLAAALDIYADDSTQVDDEKRKTVWIESDDEQIRKSGEEMLRRVRAEEQSWEMARSLCKYGNDYEELLVNDQGVQGIAFMPPATVRRIEGIAGDLMGFVQSYAGDFTVDPMQFGDLLANEQMQGGGETAVAFEGWRCLHMRLRGKYRAAMYGHSVFDPARWIWKRLMLLEDATLIYKLTRSPSRFAFYVDTGRLQGEEALAFVNRVAQLFKKRKFVNPKTGRLDMQFNPLGYDEDFFLPVMEGGRGTKVELLEGPTYQSMEDVEYFLKKMYAAIKIPRAYLGYDENMPSKATLSQEDVRFARTVMRIQRELRNGYGRMFEIDLAARGIDPSQVQFDVNMSVPSHIFEEGQMAIRQARAQLADAMSAHVSKYWILQNVFGLSDDEISVVIQARRSEQIEDAKYEGEAERARRLGEEGQPTVGMSAVGEPLPAIDVIDQGEGGEEQGTRAGALLPKGWRTESRRGVLPMPRILRHGVQATRKMRGAGGISERELLEGNPRQEKGAKAELERVLRSDPALTKRLDQMGRMLKDIANDTRRFRRAS